MRLRPTAQSGFSLIEVVVVMLILTLMMGVVAPRFMGRSDDAMNNRRAQDLLNVQKALEMYFSDHGNYPQVSGWSGDAQNYGGLGYDENCYIPGLVPDYIEALPRDPDTTYPDGGRGYLYRSNGQDYKFLAHQTPTVFGQDLEENKYAKLFDPRRPTHSWQVSSLGGKNW